MILQFADAPACRAQAPTAQAEGRCCSNAMVISVTPPPQMLNCKSRNGSVTGGVAAGERGEAVFQDRYRVMRLSRTYSIRRIAYSWSAAHRRRQI